ncbi:MAG: glycoside hydrolase family 28 protein [Tepidisphaeraceae bacterium]|jgi:hypothetical protein
MISRRLFGATAILWLTLLGQGGCTQTRSSWNVLSLGAKGDGATKDTAAFQLALDRCAAGGGGIVWVPAGNYLIGSIVIGPNTTLRLQKDAVLQGSSDAADYPVIDVRFEGRWVQGHRALVHAVKADHIALIGPGKIAGAVPLGGLRNPRGPCLVEIVDCRDVLLDGFSTTYDRMWSIHPTYCQDVVARNLTIRSNRGNGDGIDVDSCQNVRIEQCDIDTGDDAIAIKSGRGMEAVRIGKPSQDIWITRCKLGSKIFAAIGIGTEMSGGVRNVTIEHCAVTHGTDALYLKSRTERGGFIENIRADDIDAAAKTFLRIDLLAHGIKDSQPVLGDAGIPRIADIAVSNARVDCGTLIEASHISAAKPLEHFSFVDVTGTCKKGMFLANMTDATLRDIHVSGLAGPLLSIHNVTGTGLEGAVFFTPTTAPSTRPATRQR